MKKTILLLITLCALAVLPTGCVSTPQPDGTVIREFDAEATATIIRHGVPPLSRLAVAKEPGLRIWLVDVKVAVCSLVDTAKVTPEDLQAAVDSTGIKELHSDDAKAVTGIIYGVYLAAWGDPLAKQLTQDERTAKFSIILKSICDALDNGLAAQTPDYKWRFTTPQYIMLEAPLITVPDAIRDTVQ